MIIAGIVIAILMFGACAVMGEKNALWIPAIVLIVSVLAGVIAG